MVTVPVVCVPLALATETYSYKPALPIVVNPCPVPVPSPYAELLLVLNEPSCIWMISSSSPVCTPVEALPPVESIVPKFSVVEPAASVPAGGCQYVFKPAEIGRAHV